MTVPEELLAFAETLADAAGTVVRSYWRQPVAVESKQEPGRPVAESPVTRADREAEQRMRELIEAKCHRETRNEQVIAVVLAVVHRASILLVYNNS